MMIFPLAVFVALNTFLGDGPCKHLDYTCHQSPYQFTGEEEGSRDVRIKVTRSWVVGAVDRMIYELQTTIGTAA